MAPMIPSYEIADNARNFGVLKKGFKKQSEFEWVGIRSCAVTLFALYQNLFVGFLVTFKSVLFGLNEQYSSDWFL